MMTNNNSMAVQAPASAASLSVYSNIIFDCKGLDLYYGAFQALKKISMRIERNQITALIGPSGCGKSTALRSLAGLEDIQAGRILVGGQDVTGVPVNKRDMAMVFQAYSLFPHMTALQNVEFGLEIRGVDRAERRRQAMEKLELVGLADQAKKYTQQMSGGQQQRVAIARSLVNDPEILLLDEPFSALDYQTRLAVSADIWRIIRQEGKTALLVTHDIAEAVSMSDRVGGLSARPAVVKTVLDMGPLRGLPPLERRNTPEFHRYFDLIWKELDVHG